MSENRSGSVGVNIPTEASEAAPMNDGQVAAAVIVDGVRVLLVRRAVAEGRLLWQFPAGKAEPGGVR